MVYVVNGRVVQRQSAWSVTGLVATFWSIVNQISFFFQTLFSPEAGNNYKQYGERKGWQTGGGSRPGGGPPRGGRPIMGVNDLQALKHTAPCAGGS